MPADRAEDEGIATLAKVSDLGRYRLIAELARGGMGIVYLALVRGPGGFNKLFVVKELKAHLSEDPNLVRMFLEEARLAAKLNHPNVVQTMEVGSDGNRHFIAMEYLEGQPLNRALARARKASQAFPFHHALFVIAHMLEGLHYAHSASDFDGTRMNLVHRDVSPHNVFVTYDGQVKILDFGIAKALDSSNDTRTGMLKGKVAYMAPEQASGQPIDRRADVFSAGVMLFEAATGARFWGHAQNDLQILHALANGFIAKPRTVKPDIDPGIERIILKATAVKREERYASAAEMQSDLEAYLKQLSVPFFGARDVGKFFMEMFARDRDLIKRVIDDQLRALRGTISGEYGKLDLPRLTTSTAPSGTPSGVLLVRSDVAGPSVLDVDLAPETWRTPEGEPPPGWHEGNPPSQSPTLFEGTYRAALGNTAALTSPPKRAAGEGRGRLGIALVFVTSVAAGLFVLARLRHAPPASAPVGSAPQSPENLPSLASALAPRAVPVATAEAIRIAITVAPPEATITVDDRAPQTGAFRGTFARDAVAHTIHVESPRYEPKTVVFQAEEDRTFEFSLEHAKESAGRGNVPVSHAAPPAAPPVLVAPPSVPAPAVPPPAAVSPAPSAQPTSHVRQQIDTSDPYSQ